MRHLTRRLLTMAALLGAACTEQSPSDPIAPTPPEEPIPISPAQARQERLARSIALTLNQPQVRQAFLSAMDASPHPERKVHFQWLLAANAGWLRGIMARESRVTEGTLDRDAAEALALEVYFPVPEHRARWRGEGDLLVATAIRDSDAPVAFDRQGRRLVLDPSRPPSTPVLALVPAEQRFSGPFPTIEIEGDGVGGNATGPGPSAGLYMTYAAFTQTFESWLKGAPEFETHILAPGGASSALVTKQCAGEHAGGPYVYDQNDKTWNGTVLLYSQTQLDQFKVLYPNQGLRIVVVEDDDTACVIKTNGTRLTDMLKRVDELYRQWTGGVDNQTPWGKYFSKATSVFNVVTGIGNFLTTNDDIVGTAIEDVVAGISWPGTNWIVKGENNITNGGIRLEMR